MTAIFFPDCEATSNSGRFRIEARSPHNGTILRRNGTKPKDAFEFKYRQHQTEFRYRLLDDQLSDVGIAWERFQTGKEDSPHELVVSDDGWTIIRTHGFKPELIAVGLNGRDVLRVGLESEDGEETEKRPSRFDDGRPLLVGELMARLLSAPGSHILQLAGVMGAEAGVGSGARDRVHRRPTLAREFGRRRGRG